MANNEINNALKHALYETLNSILSPHHEVRKSAEAELKVLEITDDYGVHLAELTLDRNTYFPIRQLASVLLKKYVEAHWVQDSEKFQEPEATPEAKNAIREMLPMGLADPIRKIRLIVAYAIAAIAQWDWPDAWPNLFTILMEAISGDDGNAVHGAMRVLTEFSREVTDEQMPHVGSVIFPQMYRIFIEPEKYSISTRGRALEIFSTCLQMVIYMDVVNKGYLKALVHPVLPQFTEALVTALQVPDDGVRSDSGLKKEVINALTLLVKHLPKQTANYLPFILTPVWNTLTSSASIFIKTTINASEDVDNPVDSDGEVLGFENLIFSLFEFVTVVVETAPKFKNMVKKGLQELIYYILLYMQMSEEQISMWSSNPGRFVEDEDEETYSFSVRISAQDLLLTLSEEFGSEYAEGLLSAITKHIQEAQDQKNAGNATWWKRHEACFLALGGSRKVVLKHMSDNLSMELNLFFQNVVLSDLNLPNPPPFLIGRSLWVASRFAHILNPELSQRFLQGTVAGLQMSQAPCVRCSAVRAVYGFCVALKEHNQTMLLAPYLEQIMDGLLALSVQFSSEVLPLILDSLTICLTVDSNFTASQESRVAPLAINVLLKHSSDPAMIATIQEVFTELAKCQGCQEQFHQRLIPVLLQIIQHPPQQVPMGLQAVALDVLQTVIRSAAAPLSQPFITQVFPACVFCIARADDLSVLQNGGECVRAYVSQAYDQLLEWHDENGENGVMYAIKVALHLLDIKHSESSAAFVGRLISQLLKCSKGGLGKHTDTLLRAVLSKMQQTDTLSVFQSLVLVFAQLVHSQLDAALDFLSNVPGPAGNSALEFVLGRWLSKQHLFFGAYENKICTLALCKLLEHAIQTNDSRIMKLTVEIQEPNNHNSSEIRTRSRSLNQPQHWITIPMVVEIYKVLLVELAAVIEANMAADNDTEDEDDDEEEGAAGNQDGGISMVTAPDGPPPPPAQTSLLMQDNETEFSDTTDDDTEDPDAALDPLNQVNLEAFLIQFLRTLSQHPCYSEFSKLHTPQEKYLLTTTGILTH